MIKNIVIPEGCNIINALNNNPFNGCSGLQDEAGFVIINDTLYDYFDNDDMVHIPEGVKKIAPNSLSSKYITSVYLADSVEFVSSNCFGNNNDAIMVAYNKLPECDRPRFLESIEIRNR